MTQYQFTMHAGPTPGKSFPVEGDIVTIGREAGNPITINDAEVSRKHCKLTKQGNVYVIEDLGSTNGTFVGGQRLTAPHVLQAGNVVSLGEQINLLFDVVGDPNATVMSALPAKQAPVAPPPAYVAPASYAGQVPANPDPMYAPAQASPAAAKGSNKMGVFVGIGCLVLICLCAGALIAIDALNLWCSLFGPIFVGLGYSC
jgi:predicted component of type VI protein secretion system